MVADSPTLLLAGIGDVLGSLVGLLLLVLWVVGKLLEDKKQVARGGPPAVQQGQPGAVEGAGGAGGGIAGPGAVGGGADRVAAARAAAGGAKPQAAGGLRGEMEEFLRRAAQKAAAQPGVANRPPGAVPVKGRAGSGDKIEVLVDAEGRASAGTRREERTRAQQPRQALSKRAARGTEPRLGAGHRESVGNHVQQHVAAGTRAMAEHSSTLGQRIIQEDAQFDVQLKAKFDHEVGTLATAVRVTDTPSQSPSAGGAPAASELAALLASPGGMRQAIILNEILQRPSERW